MLASVEHPKDGLNSPPPGSTGDSSSSFVHPLETVRHPGCFIRTERFGSSDHDAKPVTEAESTFRHSGWAPRRAAIWSSFGRCNIGHRRKEAFANCGSSLWLQTDEARSAVHLSCDKCHDCWCAPCQAEKGTLLKERLAQHLTGRTVRFLTLTLRHSRTPLADQIDRLYASFTRLRHRRAWKDHVRGGLAVREEKVADADGLWHVHLHILWEGSFWEQKEISREWHAVTGDSSIVDVRRVSDSTAAAHYISKYLSKPCDQSVFRSTEHLDEVILSTRGRRRALPFGSWKSINLLAKPACNVKWITIASVENLQRDAQNGDLDALRWLEAAARRFPLFAQTFSCARAPPEAT